MKNTHTHTEMPDELAMGELLHGFEPVSEENLELQSLLAKWTKYERPDGYESIAKLGEDLQLCGIINPATQGCALVVRHFEGRFVKITLDDNLAMGEGGIVRAATPEQEPLQGWTDYDSIDAAARRMVDRTRKPWYKYTVPMMKVIVRHAPGTDSASKASAVAMGCTQMEQIIRMARRAFEYQIARDVEGFGGAAIAPELIDETDESIGF